MERFEVKQKHKILETSNKTQKFQKVPESLGDQKYFVKLPSGKSEWREIHCSDGAWKWKF